MTLCSRESEAVDEGLAGSAPTAVAWVALEQDGPWGHRALTQSHLDPDVGRAIEAAAAGHGVRPALIRRPGRHADVHVGPHTLLVGYTVPGRTWLLSGGLESAAAVPELDWAALAAGDREAVRRSVPGLEPSALAQLLVCTNGTRDLCCAVRGRPVATAMAERFPDRVWEVTHTSGHRFAPTAALLPAGTLHGRLDEQRAADLVTAADRGRTVLAGSRGRTTWPVRGQVAEIAVRTATGELGLDELTVRGADRDWLVRHADGRSWAVDVDEEETGTVRRESCAKHAVPLRRYRARLR